MGRAIFVEAVTNEAYDEKRRGDTLSKLEKAGFHVFHDKNSERLGYDSDAETEDTEAVYRKGRNASYHVSVGPDGAVSDQSGKKMDIDTFLKRWKVEKKKI